MTSMADIIATSGVSAGAIYHHYPSKNAILVAVARRAVEWPLTALAELGDDPPSPEQLFSFALQGATHQEQRVKLLVQLGAGAAADDELGEGLRAAFGEVRNAIQTLMTAWAEKSGAPPGSMDGVGQLLVGLAWGLAAQTILVADTDPESYLELSRRLLAGLPGTPTDPDER